MKPIVTGFFHKPTWTISYVVAEPEGVLGHGRGRGGVGVAGEFGGELHLVDRDVRERAGGGHRCGTPSDAV